MSIFPNYRTGGELLRLLRNLGRARRVYESPELADGAFGTMKSDLESIGRVTEEDESSMFLRGRTRLRIQRVDIRITIGAAEKGSVGHIESFADDVWGGGARWGIKRLIRAVEEM